MEETKELYVLAFLDEQQEIADYPLGGGSSQPSYIRAFDNPSSAVRSRSRLMGSSRACNIIKVTAFEVLEG